jgi:hypothetical protein
MKDINNQLALSKEQIDSVIALYSNSKYQEAIDQIIVLDESYPNVPLLFNIIGACYKELGQLELSTKMTRQLALNQTMLRLIKILELL